MDTDHTRQPGKYPRNRSRFLILPAIVVLLMITLFPVLYNINASLTDHSLTVQKAPEYIGLGNYREALGDANFINSVLVTLKIAVPALAVELLLGFLLALLLNREFAGKRLVLALAVTPFMIAPGATAMAWRLLFDVRYGPINDILSRIVGEPVIIDWLGSPRLATISLTIVDIWSTTPFIMLLLLAGLSGISPEIYEAARIDGSGYWNAFRRITLPLMKPVLEVAVLFRSIDLIKMFDQAYSLTRGGPAQATTTISFYTYRQGLNYSRVGYGAALAFIVLIAVGVLATLYIRVTMRRKEDKP